MKKANKQSKTEGEADEYENGERFDAMEWLKKKNTERI